MTDLRAQSI
jgi:hypothetical protein